MDHFAPVYGIKVMGIIENYTQKKKGKIENYEYEQGNETDVTLPESKYYTPW